MHSARCGGKVQVLSGEDSEGLGGLQGSVFKGHTMSHRYLRDLPEICAMPQAQCLKPLTQVMDYSSSDCHTTIRPWFVDQGDPQLVAIIDFSLGGLSILMHTQAMNLVQPDPLLFSEVETCSIRLFSGNSPEEG